MFEELVAWALRTPHLHGQRRTPAAKRVVHDNGGAHGSIEANEASIFLGYRICHRSCALPTHRSSASMNEQPRPLFAVMAKQSEEAADG